MEYCIVEDGIIANIIISDAEFAKSIGAQESYDGARIGDKYDPPAPEPDPPTWNEDVDAMLVDHELRLSMIELEVNTSDDSKESEV